MVSHKVFAIYDSKAEAYLQPFFAKTSGLAVRMFMQAANDEGSDFSRFAADYTLFEIGEFSEDSGLFESHEAFRSLGLALEYKGTDERKLREVSSA